jgi:FkbM family methyltransferase
MKAILPLLVFYLRQNKVVFGKPLIWDRFVLRRIAWRDLPLQTSMQSGQLISGNIKDIMFQRLFFFGEWEPAITSYFKATLKEGDTVIDVGANIGVHAMLAATCVGQNGVVHAIEASPMIFEVLQRHLAENALSNVIAHNVAIVDTKRPVTIFRHDGTNLGASTIMKHRVAGEEAETFIEEVSVHGLPLHEAVGDAALRAARLIKIDVEGAELEVLTGLLRDVDKLRNDVELIVECNPDSLAAAGLDGPAFLALLAGHGFQPLELPNSHTVRDYIGLEDLSPKPLLWNEDRPVDILFRRRP